MKPSKSARASTVWRVHADLAEHVDARPSRAGIGEADRGAEHALLLEVADPAPDRGGRGADALGQRGVAEAGVALQRANDSPVYFVEMKFFAHDFAIA